MWKLFSVSEQEGATQVVFLLQLVLEQEMFFGGGCWVVCVLFFGNNLILWWLFYRLKLETLTDKDPGIPDLFVSFEGDHDGVHATEMDVQMEQNRTQENGSDGFPLSSSQCSGSELPCSQPQPVAAQAAMEEDELKIEEYDSDWVQQNINHWVAWID